MNERIQNLLLLRLVPLVENNFNMLELGSRSSGKSYIYKEITPYAILISGGQGTVAQLFATALGKSDVLFYGNSQTLLQKAVLGE